MKAFDTTVSLYGGALDISFDCPGRCGFTQCEIMPPEDSAVCFWYDRGVCLLPAAKVAAAKQVVAKLKKWVKEAEDEQD